MPTAIHLLLATAAALSVPLPRHHSLRRPAALPQLRMGASADPDIAEEIAKRRAEREAAALVGLEKEKRSGDERITAFGARLDKKVAGDTVQLELTQQDEEHERLFKLGVKLMSAGEYPESVSRFTQAIAATPGGLTSRLGGQYCIYLSQALQAAKRKKEAVKLLQRCEAHPDGDVRKIAGNSLYIMQAPELKLGEENFMKIPDIEKSDDWGRRRTVQQEKDPPPEKYSLEWYVLQAEQRQASQSRKQEMGVAPIVFALFVVLGLSLT